MNETYVTVVGRVASELRCSTTEAGITVVSFRVATTPRRYSPSGWTDGHTSYVTVKCWRALADNAKASLRKGHPVLVHGRQSVRPWERDGRTGTSVDIDADAVGHDLRWGTTGFAKAARSAPEAAASESSVGGRSSSWDAAGGTAFESMRPECQPGVESAAVGHGSVALAPHDGWAVPGAGGANAAAGASAAA